MIDFGEHKPEKKLLDMTPMLDVVFLLLIFFLLTSIFAKPTIPLNLPEAETGTRQDVTTASISLRSDGSLLLDGYRLEPAELFERLARSMAASHDRSVAVAADRGVPFGRVVEVMDQARKSGARDIAVVTEQKP